MAEENPAAQRQTAVTAYFSSEQLQLFVVARRSVCQYSMAEENPAAQRQTAVTAAFVVYFSGKRQQEGGLVTRGKSKIINNTFVLFNFKLGPPLFVFLTELYPANTRH